MNVKEGGKKSISRGHVEKVKLELSVEDVKIIVIGSASSRASV